MTLNIDDIINRVNAAKYLHDGTSDFINSYQARPSFGSQAANELEGFARAETVLTAFSQISLFVEVAADHLMAFTKTVTEPTQTISPWVCTRSIIEACALGIWLCTPSIDVRSRVSRSFAFRYEGLRQQLTLLRVAKSTTEIEKAEAQIAKVENVALSLGYENVVNKKGERIGICEQMPSMTMLIKNTLEQEVLYRLYSAIVHGHTWALRHLSFKLIDTDAIHVEDEVWQADLKSHFLEKSITFEMVDLLCKLICADFARLIWNLSKYYGWDLVRLNRILEGTWRQLEVNTASMFWRFSS